MSQDLATLTENGPYMAAFGPTDGQMMKVRLILAITKSTLSHPSTSDLYDLMWLRAQSEEEKEAQNSTSEFNDTNKFQGIKGFEELDEHKNLGQFILLSVDEVGEMINVDFTNFLSAVTHKKADELLKTSLVLEGVGETEVHMLMELCKVRQQLKDVNDHKIYLINVVGKSSAEVQRLFNNATHAWAAMPKERSGMTNPSNRTTPTRTPPEVR